ncbi:MAG: hypothetical protein Kow00107_11380 [Planctomycetota bacterium]
MRKGFTLLEVLIVLGVFTVFGLVLALFMRSSVRNYSITSERSLMEREAAKILGVIRSDLLSAVPRSEGSQPSSFFCTYNDGRQVVAFTIDRPYEVARGLLNAGNGIDDDMDETADEEMSDGMDNDPGDGIDNDGDEQADEEAFNGMDDDGDGEIDEDCTGDGLIDEDCAAPPSPFPVVFYAVDPPRQYEDGSDVPPRPILWRGLSWDPSLNPSQYWSYTAPSTVHFTSMPLSKYCMLFEMRFATSETTSWLSSVFPDSGGPHFLWDSTRKFGPGALGSQNFPEGRKHAPFHSESGETTSQERVFPGRILVSIGLVPDDEPFAYLTKNISSSDSEVFLNTTDGLPSGDTEEWADLHQLLYVGGEWIVYEQARDRSVTVAQRGARFTAAKAHYAGEPVWKVLVFTTEVFVPAAKMPK